MDLRELKNSLLQNKLVELPLIFIYEDQNLYLCSEYIQKIKALYHKELININTIEDITDDDLFDSDNNLYVLTTDKIDFALPNKSLIILTKTSANLTDKEVIFPKLLNWQIEDYMKARIPGLDESQIKWLCEISNYDIYRLDNEARKIALFPTASQQLIFEDINNDDGYADLTSLNIFNFTNALLKRDNKTLANILSDLIHIDVEATGVVTVMLRQIKNLIDVQMNPYATAESLNMKPNQFNAIKYNKGKFSDKQLINIFQFLTSVDMRIKNGELTLQDTATHLTINNKLVDYITINLITLANN